VNRDLDTDELVARSIEVGARHGFDLERLQDDPLDRGVRLAVRRRA
jgi:hypothetical protein